jgi:RNA polymerase sigma factor (TIGR02999 family)
VENGPGEVTQLLDAIRAGDGHATDRLLPLVYDELRRLARARLSAEPAGLTLQPTALVHEAYMRLVGEKDGRNNAKWQNHAHFFGAAAIAMRRILIERARLARNRVRKDSAPVTELDSDTMPDAVDLLALDQALEKLSAMDPRLTEVVHLRFFAGLSVEQTAEVMGVSARTVKRDWNFARAWLHGAMTGKKSGDVKTDQSPGDEEA